MRIRTSVLVAALGVVVTALATVLVTTGAEAAANPVGPDVSGYQGNVSWSSVKSKDASFAYMKATEGTGYTNPYFAQQYNGSYTVGLIRGAYHFALPDRSTGATQADYFLAHGGGWSKDGRTLPGALDIEYNPYGATCYGKSAAAMVSWISSFVNRYHTRTTRWPVIYTTTNWWSTCTGGSTAFAANDPLWVARYASSVGALPAGWGFYTFWQYADSGTFPGDQNVFNGAADRLKALACDGSC
jgi:GH25 family lysozyme M1 (1,4-beta-N-acetylmuramidase)